jgi:hypothetical protein
VLIFGICGICGKTPPFEFDKIIGYKKMLKGRNCGSNRATLIKKTIE